MQKNNRSWPRTKLGETPYEKREVRITIQKYNNCRLSQVDPNINRTVSAVQEYDATLNESSEEHVCSATPDSFSTTALKFD